MVPKKAGVRGLRIPSFVFIGVRERFQILNLYFGAGYPFFMRENSFGMCINTDAISGILTLLWKDSVFYRYSCTLIQYYKKHYWRSFQYYNDIKVDAFSFVGINFIS